MAQSLARVLLHVIYSTKHREPLIPCDLQAPLHAYLTGVLNGIGCTPLQVGGTDDHLHALLALGRTITISDMIKEMKTNTTKWTKEHGVHTFSWQGGYGVFSVSESKAEEVAEYIRRQPEHHRHRTFQEEFREFLRRHNVPFDERYVWD